jgi:hypothetical protein
LIFWSQPRHGKLQELVGGLVERVEGTPHRRRISVDLRSATAEARR